MRRAAVALASVAFLAACNALTGVSDLSECAGCELVGDASTPTAAALDAQGPKPDSSSTDAPDGAAHVDDAGLDATTDNPDTGADAGIGCQGAASCTRVVFVTATAFAGNLGGVAGADAKCQALADLSPNARIKGHTFLAWVSTSATSPNARFTHGTMPYILGNGQLVAANWQDLTDGSLMNTGISLDEQGHSQADVAWTGTASINAAPSGQSCTDWTSSSPGDKGRYGNVSGNGNGWSGSGDDSCNFPSSLYCFEQ
jgi:hypothetical protein